MTKYSKKYILTSEIDYLPMSHDFRDRAVNDKTGICKGEKSWIIKWPKGSSRCLEKAPPGRACDGL